MNTVNNLIWQICPKCQGNGSYMINPYPAPFDCDVCNGKKIISTITGLPPADGQSTPKQIEGGELPTDEAHSVQLFMDDVHKWADETFGTERTALAPLHHLKKEVDEAIEAMETKASDKTIEELADCFILILNSSSKYQLTFKQLFECAKWKMEENKTRKWGKPDENGVCEHIKTEQSLPKEPTLRDELIKCINWITAEGSPYAIMYGNHYRFATHTNDYTIDEVIDQYLNSKEK